MSNVILIGMPGAGKSTIGVLLAKSMGYNFLDTDLIIQSQQKKKLQEIIEKRDNIEVILGATVDSVKDTEKFSGIILNKDNEKIDLTADGMFVAIGLEPDNTPFKDFIDINEWGYAASDETCVTKTEGIFVAGDCRSKTLRQITTATADGAMAAVNACRYIDRA